MYDEFENVAINGIYMSQYVASWVKAGGTFENQLIRKPDGKLKSITRGGKFMDWLKFIGLTEEEARRCRNFAANGKLELETSAIRFLSET